MTAHFPDLVQIGTGTSKKWRVQTIVTGYNAIVTYCIIVHAYAQRNLSEPNFLRTNNCDWNGQPTVYHKLLATLPTSVKINCSLSERTTVFVLLDILESK